MIIVVNTSKDTSVDNRKLDESKRKRFNRATKTQKVANDAWVLPSFPPHGKQPQPLMSG
jgi:hypothetical protein